MSESFLQAARPAENAAQVNPERDRQLVARMVEGDECALEELIQRYSALVARICLRICRDEAEVNCIVSDVFWEIWNRAHTYDSTRGSLRTYLAMIARSKAIDRRRSAVSRQRIQAKLAAFCSATADAQGADEQLPNAEMIRAEHASHVQAALEGLTSIQRQAIELAFFDGYTHDEVAKRLNTPLGTIKSRIRSGLIQLKRSLSEDYPS